MRLIRAVLPAVVAALLWLVSGGLELLGRQTLSGPVRHVLSIIAPETIPVQLLTAPAPWGFLMITLSMLGIAASYAALAALVRRQQPGSTPTAFAAYWLVAVASGTLVAATPVVVDLVVAVVKQETPFGFSDEHLAGIAHWGLVFGWIPALVAVALDAAGREGRRAYDRRMVAIPAVALFLLAATGLTVATPQAYAAVQAQIPTEPAPEPAPTGTPVPLVAPGDWQPDPLWCTSGQLEMTAGVPDAALGSRGLVMHARNVSDAACVVESYPDVAFADEFSSAIDVNVDHGGGMLSEDPGVTRIELQPGAEVISALTWSAMPTQGLNAAGWLYIAAFHGAERQQMVVETDITGGTVSVTAWGLPAE